jgi:hypothetical protein
MSVVARMTRCGAVATECMRTMVGEPPPILMMPSSRPIFSAGTFTPLASIALAADGVMYCRIFRLFFS